MAKMVTPHSPIKSRNASRAPWRKSIIIKINGKCFLISAPPLLHRLILRGDEDIYPRPHVSLRNRVLMSAFQYPFSLTSCHETYPAKRRQSRQATPILSTLMFFDPFTSLSKYFILCP